MDETALSNWFFRHRGLVAQADTGVKPEEVKDYLRVNALKKVGAGLPLSDGDKAALEATKGEPLHRLPASIYRPDVTMGFVFHEAGDLVRQLDAIALQLAARFGPAPKWTNEQMAWMVLRWYATKAEESAKEESDFFTVAIDAEQAAQPGGQKVTLPDGTELTITPTPPADTLGEALNASLPKIDAAIEGPEALAAHEAENTPDDGPDGWSQMPPANPAHPLHPDNLPPHKGQG